MCSNLQSVETFLALSHPSVKGEHVQYFPADFHVCCLVAPSIVRVGTDEGFQETRWTDLVIEDDLAQFLEGPQDFPHFSGI